MSLQKLNPMDESLHELIRAGELGVAGGAQGEDLNFVVDGNSPKLLQDLRQRLESGVFVTRQGKAVAMLDTENLEEKFSQGLRDLVVLIRRSTEICRQTLDNINMVLSVPGPRHSRVGIASDLEARLRLCNTELDLRKMLFDWMGSGYSYEIVRRTVFNGGPLLEAQKRVRLELHQLRRSIEELVLYADLNRGLRN